MFQLVGTFRVVWVSADEHFEGEFFFAGYLADYWLEFGGQFFRGGSVCVGEDHTEKARREQIHGIGGPEIAAYGAGDFSDQGGAFIGVSDAGRNAYFDGQNGQCMLHGGGAAILHGQTILEMIQIRDGMEQIGIGLMAQIDIALQLGDELLLYGTEGTLAIEQIGGDEQRQNAKAEERETHRPFCGLFAVDKYERIHEQGHPGGENKDDDGSQDGQVAFAPFEMVEFGLIECGHRLVPGQLPAAGIQQPA